MNDYILGVVRCAINLYDTINNSPSHNTPLSLLLYSWETPSHKMQANALYFKLNVRSYGIAWRNTLRLTEDGGKVDINQVLTTQVKDVNSRVVARILKSIMLN